MNLFDKLFGKKSNPKDVKEPKEERGKYMPPPETPTDDKFILNFKNNGGKFLYCENQQEISATFEQILQENNWCGEQVCCLNGKLKSMFSQFDLEFSSNPEAPFFLLTCEYLVANTGAILLSSNQMGEKKLSELPYNFVIFAGTSQLIDSLGEGLRRIKARRENLPSNITTIKNFSEKSNVEGHFMSYGSVSKNLYLLLLEDL